MAVSASHTGQSARRLAMHKKMGGETAGSAEPNGKNGDLITYDT